LFVKQTSESTSSYRTFDNNVIIAMRIEGSYLSERESNFTSEGFIRVN